MQLHSSNSNSISTFANINQSLIEDIMPSSEANDSAPCDLYSLDKSVEAAADSNISVTQTKNVDRAKNTQGKSIGGNKRASVTIPRTHKSQQHNVRQSFQGNGRNQATALSRSYQHPSDYSHDKANAIADNEGNCVLMRRSSSVPCKRANIERGSTSSSDDSGFSPGSPNTSATINVFNVEQAVKNMHLDVHNKHVENKKSNSEDTAGSGNPLSNANDINTHSTNDFPYDEEYTQSENELNKSDETATTTS